MDCKYRQRRKDISQWNANHAVIKKGIALTPVKFGISFTATQFNQAGALVSVYTDGSVRINHGGTEMGQGLHTKVCAIVAKVLGLAVDAHARRRDEDLVLANARNVAADCRSHARELAQAVLELRGVARHARYVKQHDVLCLQLALYDSHVAVVLERERELAVLRGRRRGRHRARGRASLALGGVGGRCTGGPAGLAKANVPLIFRFSVPFFCPRCFLQ